MKPKRPKLIVRVKAKARRQLGGDDLSQREAKNFLVAAIETSLTKSLKRIGFSKSEVKGLLAGSTNSLTAAVREKLRRRRRRSEGQAQRHPA